MIRTLAPSAMHWSACDFCFCGSFCAFTTRAGMPAALNALSRYGLSNCSQRTDDFVSGIRPHAWMLACLDAVPAVATATATASAATAATSPTAITLRETCFTCSSLHFVLTTFACMGRALARRGALSRERLAVCTAFV